MALSPLIFVVAIALSYVVNLHLIQADITSKKAGLYRDTQQWQVAIALGERAKVMAPGDAYYDLFLGQMNLEYAQTLDDSQKMEEVLALALEHLQAAQDKNPLDPDHTANLARFHVTYAELAPDNETRLQRGYTADQYFQQASQLSPNNATILNEWANLWLNTLSNPDQAIDIINKSIEIDPDYEWTAALLGEYFVRLGNRASDSNEKRDAYQQAAVQFENAIALSDSDKLSSIQGLNYYYALISVYQVLEQPGKLIIILEDSLNYINDPAEVWKIEVELGHSYGKIGEKEKALEYYGLALVHAPQSEQANIQEWIADIDDEP